MNKREDREVLTAAVIATLDGADTYKLRCVYLLLLNMN